jgi:5-methylcytosine-specific restriction endonuclease McrA
MRERKQSIKQRFLEKRGLTKVPRGKEIDHKVPLKDGGTDTLRNLHLIKKSSHRIKTASEARRRAR